MRFRGCECDNLMVGKGVILESGAYARYPNTAGNIYTTLRCCVHMANMHI